MTELPASFGKYFLTEKLATGGMAEIYLGKLVGPGGFEKQLVIKQIHPKLSGQRHFVDLFVAEAKTLVTLAHGNIVPVYELGVIDDTYFIAMEYIDGPTLYRLTDALARQGAQMEPAVAAFVTAKILEGLDYAHRKGEGVIHRDLSPRNVMLSRDGEVKLVDFGIAVTLGAADGGADVQSAPTGSFPYMSPEQVRREPLTGQTDLFSVGVLMWEMLVGKRLFARPDPDATLAAVTTGDIPRPSSVRPEIPARLDEVVMRALERDQAARWSTAGDMLAAIQRYLYALEATPGPRDVAALVARYCPPETRRVPTHAEPAPADDSAPVPAGPRTAVVPRDARPRGKRARTETFATHVELKNILETPLFGTAKLPPAEEAGPSTVVTPREKSPSAPPPDADEPPVEAPPTTSPRASMRLPRQDDTGLPPREALEGPPADRPVFGRKPPSRAGVIMAAVGTIALGIAALYVFSKGRGAVTAADAPIRNDAPWYAFDPDARGPDPSLVDAGVADAPDLDAPPDAAPPEDAAPPDARGTSEPVRDAGPRPVRDAGVAIDAGTTVAAGTGKVAIGANPWGEIVVDGVPRGRTPKELELAAGRHTVDVIYRGEEPPVKKTFTITVTAGETTPVLADFTR